MSSAAGAMGRCHESRLDVCVPRRDAVESRSIARARRVATAGGLVCAWRSERIDVRDDVGASHLDELDTS